MRIAVSIYVFAYQPDGCSVETARVCPSARPDAAQGAEQHVDKGVWDSTANGPVPKAGRGRMTPSAVLLELHAVWI